MQTIKLALLGIIFAVLAGCASFPQQRIPLVDANLAPQSQAQKPTAYVDFKFYMGNPSEGTPTERPAAVDQLKPIIESTLVESGVFSDVVFDSFKKDTTDYVLEIKAYNHGSQGAAAVSGFLTGFTFGVIPGVATDNYTVETKLKDNRGQLLASNSSEDSVRTWIGIWFIPIAFNTPEKAVTATLSNQVRHSLKQMIDDRKLNVAAR